MERLENCDSDVGECSLGVPSEGDRDMLWAENEVGERALKAPSDCVSDPLFDMLEGDAKSVGSPPVCKNNGDFCSRELGVFPSSTDFGSPSMRVSSHDLYSDDFGGWSSPTNVGGALCGDDLDCWFPPTGVGKLVACTCVGIHCWCPCQKCAGRDEVEGFCKLGAISEGMAVGDAAADKEEN